MGWLTRWFGGSQQPSSPSSVADPRARGSVDGTPPPTPPTDQDVAMMREALLLARQAAEIGEVPVGAVVYDLVTHQIIGRGSNRREIDHDPSAHAEWLAIRVAATARGDWRLSGCGLAVTLEPCPMCAGLIVNARVDRLVYGATDPKAGACGSLFSLTTDSRLNHRVTPVAGVLAEESAALLRDFFRQRRKSNAGS